MRDGFIAYFLMMLLRRLPMILLAVGAIIFALIRWKYNARSSLITVIAFIIYLIDMVFITTFVYWSPARGWIEWFIFFVEDFATAAIFILLTAAAFIGRDKTTSQAAEAS